MKAFTDYPFTSLGDEPGKKAPVRECKVISYDDNKYCEIIINGEGYSIKSGYLYSEAGRCGDAPPIDVSKLLIDA